MVVFQVGELEVEFPFVPYDVQKEVMRKVLECIEGQQNGLLESPTGTGKTLALLCAALSWQKKQVANARSALIKSAKQGIQSQGHAQAPVNLFNVPKIIYASRTHAQLSQAAQELKRSFYSSTKSVVLGSRDVMCIHEGVSRLPTASAKIMACHVHVKSRTCHFYNTINQKKEEISSHILDKPIMDIEDLVTTGRKNKCCPFFLSREVVKDASIIFMPYNYLMDPKLRSSHGVDLKNCIIILDEGHNIAKTCEESVSFELKSSTIAKCIQEITQTMNEFTEISKQIGSQTNALVQDLDMGTLVMLKQSFLQLEHALDSFKMTDSNGSLIPANEVLMAIFQNGFPPSTFPAVVGTLDAVSSFQAMSRHDSTGCDGVSSMLRILSSQAVFSNPVAFSESYKIFLTEEKRPHGSTRILAKDVSNVPKIFNFWCFNPAIGLDMMLQYGPRCIILASGTLSPLSFLECELRAPFPVKLSNPHIIGDSQLFASVLKAGPAPKFAKLTSAYTNRSNPDYLNSLGEVIATTCSVVPKGVLVFFPSYTLMDSCVTFWKQSGMMNKMENAKPVYVEPKGKFEFNQMMTSYYQAVRNGNGACLMAVCRGKVSEGLDFADDNGRAVIITGIPYAPLHDPQVQAKKAYLDSKNKGNGVSGANWYQMEAIRALNQAVGRIIRHAQDFGAVLLCDDRFDYPMVLNNLSPWLEKRLKKSSDFSEVMTGLAQFFKAPSKSFIRNYPTQKQIGGLGLQTGYSSVLKPTMKPKVFDHTNTNSSNDIDMDCDLSALYAKSTQAKESASTNVDLFSKIGSLKIRPACDFVKTDSNSISTREVLSSSNSLKRPIPSLVNKRGVPTSSTLGTKGLWGDSSSKQKRIKLDVQMIQPYNSSFSSSEGGAGNSLNSHSSGSGCGNTVTEMEIDSDSPPAMETPTFRNAKGFSSWVKSDLSPAKYSRFVDVMREFKTSKNVELLGEELKKLFAGNKFHLCLDGLKFVLHDSYNVLLEKLYARENYDNNYIFG